MSQRYNDNTKRPKAKGNQGEILKIYAFSWKIQLSASGPGESAVGVTYLYMRIHPKSCHIFSNLPHPTLQTLTYIEGNDRTGGPIWNYATGTLKSWKGC